MLFLIYLLLFEAFSLTKNDKTISKSKAKRIKPRTSLISDLFFHNQEKSTKHSYISPTKRLSTPDNIKSQFVTSKNYKHNKINSFHEDQELIKPYNKHLSDKITYKDANSMKNAEKTTNEKELSDIPRKTPLPSQTPSKTPII